MRSLLLVTLIILAACNTKNKPSTAEEKTPQPSTNQAMISEPTYQLLQTRCLICHTDKNLSHEELIAPPMAAVKNRYADITDSKEEFIEKMVSFTLSPSMGEAVMYGAVRRFNLMPPVIMPEDTLRKIAAFLYDKDISAPDWFAEHYKEMHPEGQPNMSLEIVDKIEQINKRLKTHLAGNESIQLTRSSYESLQKIAKKIETAGEKESLEQYHQLSRSLIKMIPAETNNEKEKVYVQALKNKLELMHSADLREEAEFIMLHLRRQLNQLDQHFVVA